ncbi:hypothetical protein L9F63_000888, partial [Diploptera punctata]
NTVYRQILKVISRKILDKSILLLLYEANGIIGRSSNLKMNPLFSPIEVKHSIFSL